MLGAFFTLLLAIFAYTGPVKVAALGPPVSAFGYIGITSCAASVPTVAFAPNVSLDVLVHEFLHAVDCADDGLFNDSLLPQSAHEGEWMAADRSHKWVYWALANPTEAAVAIGCVKDED